MQTTSSRSVHWASVVNLTLIAMHSACYYLVALAPYLLFLISERRKRCSKGGGGINVGQGQATVSSFMGMRVIVDDLWLPIVMASIILC